MELAAHCKNSQSPLAAFKESFLDSIDSKIIKEIAKDPSWLPSKYGIEKVCLGWGYISLKASDGCLSYIKLPPVPRLESDDLYSLRRWMNTQCEVRGFLPYRPRRRQLSPKILAGLQKLDSDSWHTWIERNYPKFISVAQKNINRLKKQGVASLFDAEDLVSHALYIINNHLTKNGPSRFELQQLTCKVIHTISLKIGGRRKKGDFSLRKQDGPVSEAGREKWHESLVAPSASRLIRKDHLLNLVESVKPHLSKAQMKVLEYMLSAYLGAENVSILNQKLKTSVIARNIMPSGSKPMSRQAVSTHLRGNNCRNGIAAICLKTAKFLADEDPDMAHLYNYIFYLTRKNS